MSRIYLLKIDSLNHTFSMVESGADCLFQFKLIANADEQNVLSSLSNDDIILCIVDTMVKIIFTVSHLEQQIYLHKVLEIENGYKISDLKIIQELDEKQILEISEEFYNEILISLTMLPLTFMSRKQSIKSPLNRIVFGAPGTGKSHALENDKKKSNFAGVERVTFHPNYSFSQFVGSYKPMVRTTNISFDIDAEKKHILEILNDESISAQEKYDSLYEQFKNDTGLTRLPLLIGLYSNEDFKTRKADGTPAVGDNSVERNHGRFIRPYVSLYKDHIKDEDITYKYVPGPFMRIYVSAKKDKDHDYLLLIEEINRANVAAVFGDVFQLLDRKDGISEYPIAASEDIRKFLADNGINEKELSIPSNMYIWATMNSADQGVFPMDTAFKRRWEFEYIDIDNNDSEIGSFFMPTSCDSVHSVYTFENWNQLRKKINKKLTSLGVNEDKLLGPFFISRDSLENVSKMIGPQQTNDNGEYSPVDFPITADASEHQKEEEIKKFIKSFESKVLMYLYEDLKMYRPQLFSVKDDNGNRSENPRLSDIFDGFEADGIEIFDLAVNNQ